MSKSEVKKIIQKYAEVLKKHRFVYKSIYLFGSYAIGKANKESDIDVAVIIGRSPRNRQFLDKEMRLWELAPQADTRIEPILLEEKDIQEETASIMGYEVLKHGILVV